MYLAAAVAKGFSLRQGYALIKWRAREPAKFTESCNNNFLCPLNLPASVLPSFHLLDI